MVAEGRVSVNWQTVFMLIPYVWIYAFYRIEKLMMGIVLLVVTAIVTSVVAMMFFGLDGYLISWLVSIGIPIYFIRKWSTEWNEKFETSDKDDDTPDGVSYKYDGDSPPEGVTYKHDNDDAPSGVTYKKD